MIHAVEKASSFGTETTENGAHVWTKMRNVTVPGSAGYIDPSDGRIYRANRSWTPRGRRRRTADLPSICWRRELQELHLLNRAQLVAARPHQFEDSAGEPVRLVQMSRAPDQVSPSTEPNYCGSRRGRPNIVCCDHRPPPMTSRDLNRRVSSGPGLVVSMREPSRQLERRAGELQVIRWPERRILRCHRGGLRDL